MRRYLTAVVLFAIFMTSTPLSTLAQNNQTEARRKKITDYIVAVEKELERRGRRERSLTEEIIMLDEDIEARVNSIMKVLTSTSDSPESRSRILGIKKDAIEGLQKSIEYYARERNKRAKDLSATYPKLSKDEVEHDVDKLNERIDKRIEQIVDITKSFTENKDYSRYNVNRRGYVHHNSHTSDQRHNDRTASDGVREKSRLIEEIRAAIKKMEQRNTYLQSTLKRTYDEKKQKAMKDEIEANRKLIKTRRAQMSGLLSPATTSTKQVSRTAAFEMNELFDEIATEITTDFKKIQMRVRERDSARRLLKPWKDRLAHAKAELAKLPPATE